jgi:ResB-like family
VEKSDSKQTITLPGSSLKVTLEASGSIAADSELGAGLVGFGMSAAARDGAADAVSVATGDTSIQGAYFTVARGKAPAERYFALSSLPSLPSSRTEIPDDPILSIGYYTPTRLTAKGAGMGGRLAQIEVLQTEDGKFYVRGFGRDGLMGEPGPIEVGKSKPLIASAKMPMQIAIQVEDVQPKVVLRKEYVPVELAREDRERAIPAIQAEMTVDRVIRPISLLRFGNDLRAIEWETVKFPDATYRVALDFDRLTLPFTLGLTRFEPGKDPGSPTPATFQSWVTLNDPDLDFKDEKREIFMNHTLSHRGWTFYQSSFHRVANPETGQEDWAYASVFQVHYDPAWKIIYSGCLFMVIGIFLQFYMRAGLFSDGGKRERALAAAKAVGPRATNSGEPVEDL